MNRFAVQELYTRPNGKRKTIDQRKRGEGEKKKKRDGKQKNCADVRHRSCSSSSQRGNYLNLLDISLVLVYFSYTVPDDDVSSRPMDRR